MFTVTLDCELSGSRRMAKPLSSWYSVRPSTEATFFGVSAASPIWTAAAKARPVRYLFRLMAQIGPAGAPGSRAISGSTVERNDPSATSMSSFGGFFRGDLFQRDDGRVPQILVWSLQPLEQLRNRGLGQTAKLAQAGGGGFGDTVLRIIQQVHEQRDDGIRLTVDLAQGEGGEGAWSRVLAA